MMLVVSAFSRCDETYMPIGKNGGIIFGDDYTASVIHSGNVTTIYNPQGPSTVITSNGNGGFTISEGL